MAKSKLELMAELQGVTVDELRAKYSEMGKKGGLKAKGSFTSSERAKELNRLSQEAKRRKKLGSEAQG